MNGWQNFYVVVGAAGSTLIGIQSAWDTVVYMVLQNESNNSPDSGERNEKGGPR